MSSTLNFITFDVGNVHVYVAVTPFCIHSVSPFAVTSAEKALEKVDLRLQRKKYENNNQIISDMNT